ncbi:unnamed protein product [Adineta ricciae]|uniref:Ubiquitin-fold modifier-conjugating enzyme 1 n=2 Tax=Adineta ricciae TaxID=249248 RepID=A0A816FXL8_ADIRI|nr:unnamed protein product [Adineta ricciae]
MSATKISELSWFHDFPPFFTLQPNLDTRRKQLDAWCSLILDYCRMKKVCTFDVNDASKFPPFSNAKINRQLDSNFIQVILEELRSRGNIEWEDKSKRRCLVLWKSPEEWAKTIYQWITAHGMNGTVCTFYELLHGDDTRSAEFHNIDPQLFRRVLGELEKRGQATVFADNGAEGMVDEVTKKTLSNIPLLKTKASPRDGEQWRQRLKEELQALIQYVKNNKEADNDWFRLESNQEGTRWWGKAWTIQDMLRYEFDIEFDIPVTYPMSAPEIAIPDLDGKTAKMYRGGKICMTDHFQPLWARNVPRFGIAHALALGLGPWLAVEIPDLIARGIVVHKEKTASTTTADGSSSTK